ncbi:hypothetical protein NCLIV_065050 [Neospora caninum Liverpool]|uniref:Mitochondrial carrier superfamily protein n=1 Tax=Neospora caninum (strain Liverpool) TaxID=572307 RepID=F0VQT2_NEOCL|nr:hypothetical protein NCLIV_065050 [Neospora caninum Liverpool]CBZ56079.1 hypothetical protein NCLIV_065050 [Neospora caninum Liverpool]|eukprot:XP_003886105.1 hypothetical protein NCLIV_065050 [Neospora caninum Liverpool]
MSTAVSASSSTAAAKDDLTPFERMLSGMASGILTKTACAPMDRLRLLFQVQGMLSHQQERQKAAPHSPSGVPASSPSSRPSVHPFASPLSASVSSPSPPSSSVSNASLSLPSGSAQFPTPLSLSQQASSPKKYSGVLASLRLVIQEEGVPGLWRGNAANACRAAAAYAVKFPANDWARGLIERMQNSSGLFGEATNRSGGAQPDTGGGAAGALKESLNQAQTGENQVSGRVKAREEMEGKTEKKGKVGVAGLMLAGSIAGALQKALCYPLDLVSVRIAMGINTAALAGYAAQNESESKASPRTSARGALASSLPSQAVPSSASAASSSSPSCSPLQRAASPHRMKQEARLYSGIAQCVTRIYTTEGLPGFYKGFAVSLWSGAPYVMLQMTFYELWKSLANFCAQIIVFPFDTARKRLMADGIDGRKKLSCRACLISIYRREGFAALFAGLWPATLRCLPAGALQFTSYECFKFFFQMQHERHNGIHLQST